MPEVGQGITIKEGYQTRPMPRGDEKGFQPPASTSTPPINPPGGGSDVTTPPQKQKDK